MRYGGAQAGGVPLLAWRPLPADLSGAALRALVTTSGARGAAGIRAGQKLPWAED